MSTAPAPIEIETGANPRASIVLMHGLGADGYDFVPLVPELNLPEGARVRFVADDGWVLGAAGDLALPAIETPSRWQAWIYRLLLAPPAENAADFSPDRERLDASVVWQALSGIPASSVRASTAANTVVVAAAVAARGRVDACVANAGVSSKGTLLTDMSLEEFRRVQRINVDGVFLTFRAAARHMAQHGQGGSLVATASTAAVEGAARNSHYGASKGAVTALVRALAVELARHKILDLIGDLATVPLAALRRTYTAELLGFGLGTAPATARSAHRTSIRGA